jgi:hypothetical protein
VSRQAHVFQGLHIEAGGSNNLFLSSMTLQQKRRAMAEACPGIFTIQGDFVCWRDTVTPVEEREWLYAVHLAEGTLQPFGIYPEHYAGKLMEIVPRRKTTVSGQRTSYISHYFDLIHASETQRLDAFLKVKGLWRDGE